MQHSFSPIHHPITFLEEKLRSVFIDIEFIYTIYKTSDKIIVCKDGTNLSSSESEIAFSRKIRNTNLNHQWLRPQDFELHSNKNTNSKQILRYLNKKFYKITNTPEEINVLSRWPHLVSGYESKFYSYMWSDEYAKKIYDKFKKTNNIKLFANKYMEMLLEPGSLMNYEQELKNFLELKI